MSNQLRIDRHFLIAVMGVGSSALTGVVLGLIEAWTGFALYSLMFWFIIPVGAILAGFAAASGYFLGAKLFHQKPAGGVALNMIFASVSAYLLVHYIPYYLLEIDGVRVKDGLSFWSYLDLYIRNTSLSFRGKVSTGELGSMWGYIYAVIQLIGFSLGGFAVFAILLDSPYCEKCSKYLNKTSTQDRYTREGEVLFKQVNTFADMLNRKRYLEALEFHSLNMGSAERSNHHLRTRITTHNCKTCGINHLNFIVSRLEKGDWKDVEETRMRVWFGENIAVGSQKD